MNKKKSRAFTLTEKANNQIIKEAKSVGMTKSGYLDFLFCQRANGSNAVDEKKGLAWQ